MFLNVLFQCMILYSVECFCSMSELLGLFGVLVDVF